jgi:L-ascorbate metabolism protein UlaG (beta-lactamase superfamily)
MSMDITWFGNAWFRLRADGKLVHFDPLSDKYQKMFGVKAILGTSEKADLVAISHSHPDHWDKDTLDSLRGPATVIVAPHKPAKSIEGAKEIEAGASIAVDGIDVKAVSAYNLHKFYHRKGHGVGYLVKIGGKTIYHAGDTDFIPEMTSLGKVDVALLPIGGKYTMDVKEAAQAARAISPAIVIPMHNLDTDRSELARLLADVPSIRTLAPELGKPFPLY